MKRITTTMLCLFALNSIAFGAKLKPLNQPTDAKLNKVVKLFSSYATTDLWQGYGSGEIYLAKFISKRPEELLKNTVLQVIYWTRVRLDATRWAIPEDASIKKVRKTIKNIEKAASYAVSQPSDETSTTFEQALADLSEAIRASVSQRGGFKLYMGDHGNSFGSCTLAAIVDEKNGEIAVLNSCFAV